MHKMLVEVSSLDIAWQEMQNRCRHKHLCSLDNKDGECVCVCVCVCVCAEVKTGVCQSPHIMEHKVTAPNLKQAKVERALVGSHE